MASSLDSVGQAALDAAKAEATRASSRQLRRRQQQQRHTNQRRRPPRRRRSRRARVAAGADPRAARARAEGGGGAPGAARRARPRCRPQRDTVEDLRSALEAISLDVEQARTEFGAAKAAVATAESKVQELTETKQAPCFERLVQHGGERRSCGSSRSSASGSTRRRRTRRRPRKRRRRARRARRAGRARVCRLRRERGRRGVAGRRRGAPPVTRARRRQGDRAEGEVGESAEIGARRRTATGGSTPLSRPRRLRRTPSRSLLAGSCGSTARSELLREIDQPKVDGARRRVECECAKRTTCSSLSLSGVTYALYQFSSPASSRSGRTRGRRRARPSHGGPAVLTCRPTCPHSSTCSRTIRPPPAATSLSNSRMRTPCARVRRLQVGAVVDARERVGEPRLATAGRTDDEDSSLGLLDIGTPGATASSDSDGSALRERARRLRADAASSAASASPRPCGRNRGVVAPTRRLLPAERADAREAAPRALVDAESSAAAARAHCASAARVRAARLFAQGVGGRSGATRHLVRRRLQSARRRRSATRAFAERARPPAACARRSRAEREQAAARAAAQRTASCRKLRCSTAPPTPTCRLRRLAGDGGGDVARRHDADARARPRAQGGAQGDREGEGPQDSAAQLGRRCPRGGCRAGRCRANHRPPRSTTGRRSARKA